MAMTPTGGGIPGLQIPLSLHAVKFAADVTKARSQLNLLKKDAQRTARSVRESFARTAIPTQIRRMASGYKAAYAKIARHARVAYIQMNRANNRFMSMSKSDFVSVAMVAEIQSRRMAKKWISNVSQMAAATKLRFTRMGRDIKSGLQGAASVIRRDPVAAAMILGGRAKAKVGGLLGRMAPGLAAAGGAIGGQLAQIGGQHGLMGGMMPSPAKMKAWAAGAGTAIKKVGGFFMGFGKMVKGITGVMARAFRHLRTNFLAIMLVGGVAAAPVVAFEKLNRAMAKGTATMRGVTLPMYKAMRKQAIDLSKTILFSASEIALGYQSLGRAGLSASESMASIGQIAKFAQAGLMDVATATDLVLRAQNAMGLKTEDQAQNLVELTRITNVLAKADIISVASIQDLASALTLSAGSFRMHNVPLEEGVALLAAFADQGRVGASAGTAAMIVYRELTNKAIKNAEAFERIGVSVFKVNGEMKSTTSIISQLEEIMSKMSVRERKVTFLDLGLQQRSIHFIQELIGTSFKMSGFIKQLKASGMAVDELANKMMTPLQKSIQFLKGSFAEWAEAMAPVVDMLGVLAQGVGSFMTSGTGKAGGDWFAGAIVTSFKWLGDGIQVFVRGLLELVASFKWMVHQIRSSALGKSLGLGFEGGKRETQKAANARRIQEMLASGRVGGSFGPATRKYLPGADELVSEQGIDLARKRASEFGNVPWFSDTVNSMMGGGKASIARQAAGENMQDIWGGAKSIWNRATAAKPTAPPSLLDRIMGKGRATFLGGTPDVPGSSGGIVSSIVGSIRQGFDTVATTAGNVGFNTGLTGQGTSTRGSTLDAIKSLPGNIANSITNSQGYKNREMFFGAPDMKNWVAWAESLGMTGKAGNAPATAITNNAKAAGLAQVGTVEGYKQRVQAMGGQSVQAQQLSWLKKIEKGVKKKPKKVGLN